MRGPGRSEDKAKSSLPVLSQQRDLQTQTQGKKTCQARKVHGDQSANTIPHLQAYLKHMCDRYRHTGMPHLR